MNPLKADDYTQLMDALITLEETGDAHLAGLMMPVPPEGGFPLSAEGLEEHILAALREIKERHDCGHAPGGKQKSLNNPLTFHNPCGKI